MIVGDSIRIWVKFRDESNDLYDPDTVTVKYRHIDGALQTFTYPADEVVKDGTGEYHCLVSLNMAGQWFYHWEGTGSQSAVSEGKFSVEAALL